MFFEKIIKSHLPILLCSFILLISTWMFCSGQLLSSSHKFSREEKIKKAFRKYRGKYITYFSKKEFCIYLYDKKYKVIKKYKAGYGRNPDRQAKLHEGDHRTPEGQYLIKEKLSIDAKKYTQAYKKIKFLNDTYLKASEGFCKFAQPDVDTGKNAYGPRVFWLNYPNKEDKIKYRKRVKQGIIPIKEGKLAGIGYGITVHGNNDPPSVGQLSTAGCIIMFNKDIIELDALIKVGTPFIISAE